MPTKQVLFYSTVSDLRNSLSRVEEKSLVKYVVTGLFDFPEITIFSTHSEIDDLGISYDGKLRNLTTYLVMPDEEEVFLKKIPQKKGGTKHLVNFFSNPSSVTFTPSGVYHEKCIIYGTLTGLDKGNENSLFLYKLFKKEFFRGFCKIKSFQVSPEALSLLENGFRLTPNY
ncbi:MAG: hypothetical protein F6K16_36870, partial [Symploca sp. SIO2B6]|nr:hypothetical protein [Symploca sp. SIO2B6]